MELRFLSSAFAELSALDSREIRRIVRRLARFADNFDDMRPERLAGALSDLYKFRVGDYRVLYQLFEDGDAILIHQIGHRREIYR